MPRNDRTQEHPRSVARSATELRRAEKDTENSHFKNKYASLKSTIRAVKPALNAEGIVFSQPVMGGELGYFVRTVFLHVDSDTEIHTDVPLIMGKQAMQDLKSASTYARRIGLENLSGIAPSDDDDAETERAGNQMGAAIKDAWNQSVLDSIPENATPRQRAEAFTDAIIRDFQSVTGMKALGNRWVKHKSLISSMNERFPDLHTKVAEAYANRETEIADEQSERTAVQ